MDMVWHDNEDIRVDAWEMEGNIAPEIVHYLSVTV
jgi:hypothetical protein